MPSILIVLMLAAVYLSQSQLPRLPAKISSLRATATPPPSSERIEIHKEQKSTECICPHIGVANERWRVRKNDELEFKAIHPFFEQSGLKYVWTVSNGKILSGQGTSRIVVRVGNRTTPGFINAKGFVRAKVLVEGLDAECNCLAEASGSAMIGDPREVNGFANVTDLKLDEGELRTKCRPGYKSRGTYQASSDMIINVSTIAKDPENDVLIYDYDVTAGEIIGSGPNVKWDLTGAMPGTYQIVAAVDDGCGICGETKKQKVTVLEADCNGDCFCPMLSILSSKESVTAGETVDFSFISDGGEDFKDILWNVSEGKIINGQGTTRITVRVPNDTTRKVITAEIHVKGKGDCWDAQVCPTSAIGSVTVVGSKLK